jgi:Protein of unknown function (DUF3592)
MSPRFQLELDRERYGAGDTIKGTLIVVQGGHSRALEARLEYNEETADYVEVARSIPSGAIHEGELAPGMSYSFELGIPPDALPNYRSQHGELYWQVDVVSDEAGRDTHERRRIEVTPDLDRVAERIKESAPVSDGRRGRSRPRGASDLTHWLLRAFVAIGVVVLISGAVLLVRAAQFVRTAEHATGAVVAVSRETDSDGEVSFYPVVRFTTADGKQIQFKSSSGSSSPSHKAGENVDVLYDPDDPSDAKLSGFFDLWGLPGIFLFIGAVFVGVPITIIWLTGS